jgi:NADH/F420H2 dehydrogenase subunit C
VSNEEILSGLQAAFPDAAIEAQPDTKDDTIVVPADRIVDACKYLRDVQGYDYLSDLTAVDWPERFEVVYHLFRIAAGGKTLVLKVPLADKGNPSVPSVFEVWNSANFLEREVYDLMGIGFDGHPDLRRIMLWDGFPGHPLRKEFQNRLMTYKELEPTRPKPPDW